MPMTPDHHPGQIEYQDIGIVMADAGAAVPTSAGSLGYSNALFSLTDGTGTYEPRSAYTLTHTGLRDLIHLVDDGPVQAGYKVITYVGNVFVKTVTWYTDSTQTKKIVDRTLSYPSGSYATVTQDMWRLYSQADGATILHTLTDAITYQGITEVSRTRTYN